jgi:Rps23 Pro-64 3,4-dihydroxylase Tpa1-like proline 4-hydroxylase
MRVQTASSFFSRAADLRRHFEERVGPDRVANENRFVWDYWHIPGQYTYFRTLALNVIPPSLLAEFTEALRAWGRTNLGADRVTMPWLSFYVEGCRQELHSDVIQGMWSYVYSLTPWEERRFTGGETLLAGERLLDYWKSFDPEHSSESRHLIERIPAHFDQLCVFDSRLPHGVAVVEGTREPLQARVALHGWFHDPEPSSDGPLTIEDATPVLEVIRSRWREEGARLGPFSGAAVWRLTVDEAGAVPTVELVVDNLVGVDPQAGEPMALLSVGEAMLHDARFPARSGPSSVLVPLG